MFMTTPPKPTIDPAIYDDTTVEELSIIHVFAHGHATDAAMAERIIRPWCDADARLTRRHARREEAPAA